MAERLSKAHLVVGRSGASTCAELAIAALPSVLIPLKIATDDHQRLNAKALVDAGAAAVILEDTLTVDGLTAALDGVLSDPARLAAMSAAARSVAIPDAAERLADLVEATAGRR
jgi:UDP-N-acetylglucosamine--N-acetylmuramyl-(pentapeptide) pyrophosphoryl-undecaprenol N-acetylglucosamine transferase